MRKERDDGTDNIPRYLNLEKDTCMESGMTWTNVGTLTGKEDHQEETNKMEVFRLVTGSW